MSIVLFIAGIVAVLFLLFIAAILLIPRYVVTPKDMEGY